MGDRTERPYAGRRPLPPAEMYRLAGERMAELACEVEDLRREVYGGHADDGRVARDAERELHEAEDRVDGCRRIMERALHLMEAAPGARDGAEVAWAAASETLELASREERDLTRRRAELAFELYAQQSMTATEAEECLARIETRLAILSTEIERARLALSLIEAREDRALSVIGRGVGDDGPRRRLRPRLARG